MKTCGDLAKHVNPMNMEDRKKFAEKIGISGVPYLTSLITYHPDAKLPKIVLDGLAKLKTN